MSTKHLTNFLAEKAAAADAVIIAKAEESLPGILEETFGPEHGIVVVDRMVRHTGRTERSFGFQVVHFTLALEGRTKAPVTIVMTNDHYADSTQEGPLPYKALEFRTNRARFNRHLSALEAARRLEKSV